MWFIKERKVLKELCAWVISFFCNFLHFCYFSSGKNNQFKSYDFPIFLSILIYSSSRVCSWWAVDKWSHTKIYVFILIGVAWDIIRILVVYLHKLQVNSTLQQPIKLEWFFKVCNDGIYGNQLDIWCCAFLYNGFYIDLIKGVVGLATGVDGVSKLWNIERAKVCSFLFYYK